MKYLIIILVIVAGAFGVEYYKEYQLKKEAREEVNKTFLAFNILSDAEDPDKIKWDKVEYYYETEKEGSTIYKRYHLEGTTATASHYTARNTGGMMGILESFGYEFFTDEEWERFTDPTLSREEKNYRERYVFNKK